MFEMILVFAFIVFLTTILERPYVKRIAFAKDTEEAISVRRKIIALRISIAVVVWGLYVVSGDLILTIKEANLSQKVQYCSSLVTGTIVFVILAYYYNGFKSILGNISVMSKASYLTVHKEFVLFLRGFSDDDYSSISEIKLKKFDNFSEYCFMSLLEYKGLSACAIGMTKESDSPIGAKRIYVDDISWKSQVKDLIEKSQSIYILVCDRESCIWEIRESIKYLDKVKFIVDDLEVYGRVREALIGELDLPQITLRPGGHIILISFKGDVVSISAYSNEIDGYAEIFSLSDKEKRKFKKKFKRKHKAFDFRNKKLLIVCLIICIITFSFNFFRALKIEWQVLKEETNEMIYGQGREMTDEERCVFEQSLVQQCAEVSNNLPEQLTPNLFFNRISFDESNSCFQYNFKFVNITDDEFKNLDFRSIAENYLYENLIKMCYKQGIEIKFIFEHNSDVEEVMISNDDIEVLYYNID